MIYNIILTSKKNVIISLTGFLFFLLPSDFSPTNYSCLYVNLSSLFETTNYPDIPLISIVINM